MSQEPSAKAICKEWLEAPGWHDMRICLLIRYKHYDTAAAIIIKRQNETPTIPPTAQPPSDGPAN